MLRRILSTILIFVALAAIAGGIVYWAYDGYMYYRTDDAQVSGQIININASEAGTLSSLNVTVGETVSVGQALGTITAAPAAANTAAPTISLTAPLSGTILQVPAVQGQAVAPGLQLISLTNLNTLSVTAYVDEDAIHNLSINQAVDIHLDAYSDTSFTGHVLQVVQAAAGQFALLPNEDPTSGNFTKVGQRIPVVVTLDSKNGKDIVPGMSAEITIHLH